MAAIFRRPELARQMASQLLHPGVLDEALRSGLFFSGLRRTGKTTFLVHDLIPALEAGGAIVIYVDLWSDTQASPALLVYAAIRKALADLQTPASTLMAKLRTVKKAQVEAMGLAFGFEVERLGELGGPTLAQALTEVVDKAGTDVVLIVDEVQHAMSSDEGNRMLVALKSARDAINPRPNTAGHFIFVGTGSHRAMVNELITRRSQAFAGASSVDYPVLDASFVQYMLDRLSAESAGPWPSLEVSVEAFHALGHRPEELVRALRQLHHLPPGTSPDPNQTLPIIAATMRSTAAEIDTARLWQMELLRWRSSTASRPSRAMAGGYFPPMRSRATPSPWAGRSRSRRSNPWSTRCSPPTSSCVGRTVPTWSPILSSRRSGANNGSSNWGRAKTPDLAPNASNVQDECARRLESEQEGDFAGQR